MTVTFNEVDKILKTLPIGYYIKRNVAVSLDEKAACSHYVPMEDKICISFAQLQQTLKSLDDNADLEENVRTMLYHEVSHAFITPKQLRATYVVNIFEDERIESVLRHYYINVNFRDFVKRVNNFKNEPPTSAMSAFYQLVRYRIGKRKWLDKLHNLIIEYRDYNRLADYHDCRRYERAVTEFYLEFKREWNSAQSENQQSDYQETTSSQMNSSDNCSQSEESDEQTNDLSCGVPAKGDENEECSKELAQVIVLKSISECVDSKMIDDVTAILQNAAKSARNNGSAINAYSGVFNARSVIRDDYKYFVQKNRLGHLKEFSKIHLNLFIDRSGSFWESEDIVNKLLYALVQFEKQNTDFSFDLITCGISERVEDRANRQLKCAGGNALDEKIFEIFRTMQYPNQMNYNIVLFDGDAFSDYSYSSAKSHWHNFAAFDTSNTVIISDYNNEQPIKRNVTSAKKIFTSDYTKELYNHVMIALQTLTR